MILSYEKKQDNKKKPIFWYKTPEILTINSCFIGIFNGTSKMVIPPKGRRRIFFIFQENSFPLRI